MNTTYTNDFRYLVLGAKFWEELPFVRELTCGRVRFTDHKCLLPTGAGIFALKAEALLAMKPGDVLLRETNLGNGSWHYQLLSLKN